MLWPTHGGWPWPVPPPSPFDVIARKERRDLIELCLVDLTRENVRILRMRYYRDLSFKDIARALDSSENAAMQAHGRILDRMRDRLKTAGVRRLKEVL